MLVNRRKADEVYETVDLQTLCRESDIISVHVPLTGETRGMIGREHFDLLQDGAVFLNTARGAIIREAEKTYVIPKNDPNLKRLQHREDGLLGGEQLIKTYLEQFMIFLIRSMVTASVPNFPQKEEKADPLVEDMLQYLMDNVEKNIRIEDLCKEFDYSRSYLSHRFQSKTGQTLAACAMKIKIREAKRLIRETDMNLSQISARLAFESPQYFSRVFKRVTGMTPPEFKNRVHV